MASVIMLQGKIKLLLLDMRDKDTLIESLRKGNSEEIARLNNRFREQDERIRHQTDQILNAFEENQRTKETHNVQLDRMFH